jgi:hypothetical protein
MRTRLQIIKESIVNIIEQEKKVKLTTSVEGKRTRPGAKGSIGEVPFMRKGDEYDPDMPIDSRTGEREVTGLVHPSKLQRGGWRMSTVDAIIAAAPALRHMMRSRRED